MGGMEGCVGKSTRKKEVWHRFGGEKKYKSGKGNWQSFSWDETTRENGGSTLKQKNFACAGKILFL